jgi:hypothetical protein
LDAVLKCERGDPEVIRGNGGALLPQLQKHAGVMFGGYIIWRQNRDPRACEKLAKTREVLRLATTGGESRPQFTDHDQGQIDLGARRTMSTRPATPRRKSL